MKEEKKIKIFVSHSAGSDHERIDQPLFEDVIGGAVYDTRDPLPLTGDHTGEHISALNRHFSENSVLYWAWKNKDLDYYGLCHYRRFLSFADTKFRTSGLRQVCFDGLTQATAAAAGLLDADAMRRVIEAYDMVVPVEHDVVKNDCKDHRIKSVKQFWLRYHASYLKESELDLIPELIQKHNPQYLADAQEYMRGTRFRGFNCFVMKREIFQEYCEYLFPMLFEFEERCDRTDNSTLTNRNTGYMAEWFFSIFVYHKLKEKKCRIRQTQLIVFYDTAKRAELDPVCAPAREGQGRYAKTLPIVMAVTERNIHRAAVTVESLMERTSADTFLDLILLHGGSTVDRWKSQLLAQKLKDLADMRGDRPNVSIRVYDPAHEIGRLELSRHLGIRAKEAYYPILLPFILQNYASAVYLSDTMLAQGDLSSITDCLQKKDHVENVEKCVYATHDLAYAAMTNGFTKGFRENFLRRVRRKGPCDIYSSDVFVCDLEKARKRFDRDEVIDMITEHVRDAGPLTTTEAFNLVYGDVCGELSQDYNPFMILEPDSMVITEFIPEELDQGGEAPILYNLRSMHWETRDIALHAVREYMKTARNTPFYEENLLDLSWFNIREFEKKVLKKRYVNRINEEYVASRKTKEQMFADELFPLGSPLRGAIDAVLPKGSGRQEAVKKVIRSIRK